jgi:hypothetical protein
MHKFLTLKIDDDSDNENNKINYCKTVNFKINNNSTNDNKNITYDYHKVHRYCHDFLFSPKSLYITPNINQKERKKRYIKLQVKGYTKKISYNEFQKIKALDKKKLINTRDTLKNRIKIKELEFFNNKTVYDPKIMDKISEKREIELRTTIFHMSNALHNRHKNLKEESQILYSEVLKNIKIIYEKVLNDILEKKNNIRQRINLRLIDCDYRQKKLLDEKIQEQEMILRNLHSFTYEMQRVKENYEILRNKIDNINDKIFDLEQKIRLEINRYNQINSLLKEYKVRINNMVKAINRFREREKQNLENEKISNEKNNISNLRIKTALETEYTYPKNSKRNSSAFPQLTTTNEFKTTENINEDDFDNEEFNINNNNFDQINKMKKRLNSAQNSAFILNKRLNKINTKTLYYNNLIHSQIPDNKIYKVIKRILDSKRNNKKYKIVSGINNNLLNENMKNLPIQNKEFRKEFMKSLFEDRELLSVLNEKEDDYLNRPFTKYLFQK